MQIERVERLPFDFIDGDQHAECWLWSAPSNACEYVEGGLGDCDVSGYYYGTHDDLAPHFCARHFYLEVVGMRARLASASREG